MAEVTRPDVLAQVLDEGEVVADVDGARARRGRAHGRSEGYGEECLTDFVPHGLDFGGGGLGEG